MNQREKAHSMLAREGYPPAQTSQHNGDKTDLKHPHHLGRKEPARAHVSPLGGEMGEDGLLRRSVGNI